MSVSVSENAWLIHSRKYTDSRILLELFCEKSGILSAVYRLSAKSSVPQMFQLMSVSWKGKHELKQVTSLEYNLIQTTLLSGPGLYCGLYLNELLSKLVAKEDPHPEIFQAYSKAITGLKQPVELEPILRQFEFTLLEALGYGLDLTVDTEGCAIADSVESCYAFQPESGFIRLLSATNESDYFTGAMLHRLMNGNYETVQERRVAKRLCRQCIDALLGGKVLKSRELFRAE